MAFNTQELENGRILVMEFVPPSAGAEEVQLVNQTMREAIERTGSYVYVIADMRHLSIGFSDLVQSMGELLSEDGKFLQDKGFTYLVGQGFMLQTIARALSQTQYGQRAFAIVETVEEGIELAQQRLKETVS